MNNNAGKWFGFASLLTILFIGLKLIGFITWNWLWVLSPIWIYVIIKCVILIIFIAWLKYITR